MDNFYELLNVKQDASREEIKQRYQYLARQLHPDRDLKSSDVQKFILIDKAWKILGSEESRRRYDAELLEINLQDRTCVQDTLCKDDLEMTSDGKLSYPCRCGSFYEIDCEEFNECANYEDVILYCSGCSLCVEIRTNHNSNKNKS